MSEVFRCDRDPRLKLSGFHDIITCVRNDDNRGGVGLFIKEIIKYKVRQDLSIFIPHIIETLFVEVENQSGKNNIVGVVYRPNTQPRADIDIFSTSIFDIMDIINSEGKVSLIMGDFNIDLLKYGHHDKTNDYVENIFSRGFMPLICRPTRVTQNSATLIDHMYSNNLTSSSSSGIIINDGSDHFGTFHLVSDRPDTITDVQKFRRKFSNTNTILFRNYLMEIDFFEIENTNDANEAYEKFILHYKAAFDRAFPLTQVKQNKRYIKRELWVTSGLLTSSRTKANY